MTLRPRLTTLKLLLVLVCKPIMIFANTTIVSGDGHRLELRTQVSPDDYKIYTADGILSIPKKFVSKSLLPDLLELNVYYPWFTSVDGEHPTCTWVPSTVEGVVCYKFRVALELGGAAQTSVTDFQNTKHPRFGTSLLDKPVRGPNGFKQYHFGPHGLYGSDWYDKEENGKQIAVECDEYDQTSVETGSCYDSIAFKEGIVVRISFYVSQLANVEKLEVGLVKFLNDMFRR